MTGLDVSKNPELQKLYCDSNKLSALDVKENTKLELLYCQNNQLTELDLQTNTALEDLRCQSNQPETLNVTQNTALKNLYVRRNALKMLDVTQNTALEELECGDNELTNLDVSKNTNLTRLACQGNQLTALDVKNNTKLTQLLFHWNQIEESVELTPLADLRILYCGKNNFSTLDVSQNTMLEALYCNDLGLTELEITSTQLMDLDCERGNNIANLDLSSQVGSPFVYFGSRLQDTGLVTEGKHVLQVECPYGDEDFDIENMQTNTNDLTLVIHNEEFIHWEMEPPIEGLDLTDARLSFVIPSGLTILTPVFGDTPEPQPEVPVITTETLPDGKVGTAYQCTIAASGTAPIAFSTQSELPAGLSLSATGELSGTPTAAGTFSIEIQAANSAGSVQKTFALTIAEQGGSTGGIRRRGRDRQLLRRWIDRRRFVGRQLRRFFRQPRRQFHARPGCDHRRQFFHGHVVAQIHSQWQQHQCHIDGPADPGGH